MSDQEKQFTSKAGEAARSIISRRSFLKSSGAAAASTTIAAATAANTFAQDGTPSPVASPAAMDHGMPGEERRAVAFFTPDEAATVEALTARIIPGSADDPGARETGVVFYIDQSLAGPNLGYSLKTYIQGPFPVTEEEPTAVEASSQLDNYRVVLVSQDSVSRYGYQSVLTPHDIYRRGIAFVNAYAQEQFEGNFVDLTEEQQDSIITDLQADEATGFNGPTPRAFFTQLRNDTIAGMFSDPMYGGNKDMAGWRLIGYPGAQRFYTVDDIIDPDFQREPQSLAQLMAAEGH
jgi:gluconate 2-dehydrogenase gamma chain